MNDAQRWAICVHEAGHALAALRVGVPVDRIELLDDGGQLVPVEWPDDERALLVLLAGPAATELLADHRGLDHEDDLRLALDLAADLIGNQAVAPLRAQRAAIAVRAFVFANRGAIEKVARALLIHDHLTGREIRALVEKETG